MTLKYAQINIIFFLTLMMLIVVDSIDAQSQKDLDINHEFFTIDSGNLEKLKEIILKGVDVNIRNDNGHTRLWLAAIKGETSLLELLLKHGADPNIKSGQGLISGFTPLHTLGLDRNPDWIKNSVPIAKLLIKYGADVNTRSDLGITPLDIAYSNAIGHPKLIGSLITFLKDNGALPNCDPNRNPKLSNSPCDKK